MNRPVRIAELSWEVGLPLDFSVNPWQAFFEDERVLRRVGNFHNLRCDMQIKILINGNPFYHGMALASYLPNHTNDSRFDVFNTEYNTLIQLSQMPHIMLNPTTSTGGDIILPWFHFRNTWSIPNSEWRNAGLLILRDLATLSHANGGTGPLTISIFAMPMNVDLSSPTNVQPLENQSDEYVKFSAKAHAVAHASGYLNKVPYIGPYARATEMAATALGNIAMLFGFSRPRITQPVTQTRPRYAGELAVSNVPDGVASLAMDAKKEVTIDPRVVGLPPNDEMGIVDIAKRPSFITSFNWPESAAPDTHLFSMRICPVQGNYTPTTQEYFITPSAFVSLPFRYWKGSMDVRIVIPASGHHRGRLRVVYDPYTNLTANAGIYNASYSQIFDIADAKDIRIRIGWSQQSSYLFVPGVEAIPNTTTSGEFEFNTITDNGTLSVYVVNELTGPATPVTTVTPLVFASMCDDFEVACPDNSVFEGLDLSRTTPVEPDTGGGPVDVPDNPPPPPPPDNVPDDNTGIDFSYSPPISYNSRLFNGGIGQGLRLQYPTTAPFLPQNQGAMAFSIPFQRTSAIPLEIKASFIPPASAPGTYTVTGTIYLDGVANPSVSQDFTYVSGSPPEMTFNLPLSALVGVADVKFAFSAVGTWGLRTLVLPPSVGQYQWVKSGIRSIVANSTATLDTTAVEPATGLLGFAANFASTSEYIQFDLSTIQEFVSASPTPLYSVVDGTNGNGFYCRAVYQDGTEGPKSLGYGVPYNIQPGYLPVMVMYLPPIPEGNICTAIRVYPYNSTVTDISFYSFGYIVPPLENQSEEIPVDMSVAPVGESESISMCPMAPDVSANHVHFGEQITSIRQLLKRYVTTRIVLAKELYDINLHDTWNDPATALDLNALHPMDYFKSAFAAYRGSIRIRMLFSNADPVVPFAGSAMISRISRGVLVRATGSRSTERVTWDGATWEPLELTHTVDAEIPFYSSLRYLPARLASEVNAFTYSDWVLGRERLWYNIYIRSLGLVRANILQAAGEDYSLHYFVCTPALKASQ